MARVGETIGTLDKLLSVLERAGKWSAFAVTLAPGAVAYGVALWNQIPSSVAAVLGLYAIAGGLWLYNGLKDLARRRQLERDRPNYEAWDHVMNLTFWQAASLWAELEPRSPVPRAAYPYLRVLKEQAGAGNIVAHGLNEDRSYYVESTVSRDQLRKLVTERGMPRPIFLFPEDR